MSNISKICGMIFFSLTALSGCSFGTVKAPEAVRIEPQYTEEELAAMRREEELVPILDEAAGLAKGYYYDEALACLSAVGLYHRTIRPRIRRLEQA